jgi:hypothetical protein
VRYRAIQGNVSSIKWQQPRDGLQGQALARARRPEQHGQPRRRIESNIQGESRQCATNGNR